MKLLLHTYRIRTFALLALVALTALPSAAQQKKNIIDQVAWIVGDEPILLSDIERQRIYYESIGQRFASDARCYISERIAIQKLFLNQAKIDSIQPNENAISMHVNNWIEQTSNELGGRDKLEEYLGKNLSDIREERRKIVREEYIVQEVQRKLVGDVKVSPSEVSRYYNTVDKDSLPFIPTTVEVQIITLQPTIAPKAIDEIKERLRGFTDDIQSGQRTFSTLARLYSQDNKTALRGGEMGFVGKAELEAEFAHVAFALPDDKKVSRIVRTAQGYHIVQLIEKRGDMINLRHIMLKPEVADADLNAAQARLDSLATAIRSDSISFDLAASRYSSDEETRNSHGQMVNSNQQSNLYGTAKFEMKDLPQEISAQVVRLKVGEVSAPFLMKDKHANSIIAVVKLKRRIDGHRANVVEDFTTIKEILLAKKRDEMLDEWIRQKQQETFVKISPDFQGCHFNYPGWIKR